jgi:2-polyprenyl-3-methyl-5-hydroxy-6-metoxy-1,4-benzoquinol methylase
MNRQQWNKLGKVFNEEVCDIVREETNDQMKRYVAAAKLPKDGAVLVDFGCGVGTFIERFGKRFAKIVGVEFAASAIVQAKVRCASMPGITWMTADIVGAAKQVGQRADLTVCLNVITSASAAKRALLWQSLSNTTKSGGYTLIVVPSLESEEMVQSVIQGRKKLKLAAPDGLIVREEATQKHFAENEIRETLADNGFAVKKLGRASYPWSIEGVRETAARAANRPWDWVCLAERN